jgi:hypothetical protein
MNAGFADKHPPITDADFKISVAINHVNRSTILDNGDMTEYRCFAQSDQLQSKPGRSYDNIKS